MKGGDTMHANATPSEIAIFNKLANPARVSKTPRDPVAKPQSVFETAVIQELKSVAMNREQGKAGSDRDSDRRDKSDRGGDQSDRGSDKREEYREQQHELDRRSSQDLETSRNNDAEVFAEQQREKEAMIDYINARATRGVRVTKTYTRDDPFVEVQFEYDRIKINEETTNSLGIAREGLRFACKAVEAGNKKFGPILALDGWVDNHMAPDTLGRFDNVLERLYKKHWRKGSMAPEMELLMLLGGSMAMTHFDNVSGKRDSAPASQPPPFARPHSSGPLPFDIMSMLSPKKASAPPPRPPLAPAPPPQQQQQQPPSGTGVRRPMRRPVDSMSVASEPETVLSKPETTDLQDAENRMKLEMMQEQNRQRERAMQASAQASVQAARQEAMIKDRLQQIEAMEFQVRQRELAMEQRLRSLELKESRQHMESDFKKEMPAGRQRELFYRQPPTLEMQQQQMQQMQQQREPQQMQQREQQQMQQQQREMHQQMQQQQMQQQQMQQQQREMQQQREQQQQMQQREQPSKEDEDSEPQEEGAVTSQGEDSGNASDSRSISVPGSHGNARRGRGSRRRKAPKNLRV